MKPRGDKFIALLLVIFLMMISTSLYAKKRGAKLIITKKDGQSIEGELITVKPNSLLLLERSGKDMSVEIEEIKIIRIVKKSKFWTGVQIGGFIGAVWGALLFLSSEKEDVVFMPFTVLSPHAIQGGVIGAILGGIISGVALTDKTIQIEGMTDSEIQETLDKLRKKARVRDYE
jgi:hypothetical protein